MTSTDESRADESRPDKPPAEPSASGFSANGRKRPLIGITTGRKGGRVLFAFLWLAVRRAGGRPLKLHAGKTLSPDVCDGFVIGGGDDISATLWGGEIDPEIKIDPERDRLELDVLAAAERRQLPVLGVCRGAQMINIFYGGTLHGDIYEAYPDARKVRTVLPRKKVDIVRGSRLDRLVACTKCQVNALHHQSVKETGDGLAVVARDQADIVQAIEHPGPRFLVGVQWHPELLVFDKGQQRLFRGVSDAARDKGAVAPPTPEAAAEADRRAAGAKARLDEGACGDAGRRPVTGTDG
jgi:putative glutamine amidotransferase